MSPGKLIKSTRSRLINTTVGEFVEAVYEAAMEEYMDEMLARRITLQVLLKRLREQARIAAPSNATPVQEKRALLRSEFNRRRAVKKS